MRFTATAAVMAGVAAASWSPDMGSHGGWGGHGAAAPPSNSTGGWGGDSYTTEVVTAFTTFCPEATQLTHGGQTYTVSEATTLTITNCPGGCTITKPASSAPPAAEVTLSTTSAVEASPVETTPLAPTGYTSEAPPASSAPIAPAPVYPTGGNGTAPAPAPSGTGSYTSATEGSPVPEQTGNSASTLSAGAAGILAVFGLVAAL